MPSAVVGRFGLCLEEEEEEEEERARANAWTAASTSSCELPTTTSDCAVGRVRGIGQDPVERFGGHGHYWKREAEHFLGHKHAQREDRIGRAAQHDRRGCRAVEPMGLSWIGGYTP